MTPPVEIDPAELLAGQPPEAAVLGAGIAQHRATVAASGLRMLPEETWAPRAATVYALGQRRLTTGESVAARNLVPLYIRRPEAEEKWEAGQLSRNLPP